MKKEYGVLLPVSSLPSNHGIGDFGINAYKFIDYLLREDVMTKIIEGYPYKNVNAKADNIFPSSYISNTSSNFSKEILKNSYMVKNIGEKVKLYDQIWTSIK